MNRAYKTMADVVDCELNIHPTPVIKYITDTRCTEYEPHVILRAFRSRTETMQQQQQLYTLKPTSTTHITFGGSFSSMTRITLNNVELKRVAKLKYLGCYFHKRSCKIDFSYKICKFYGKFNNIMSVFGYNRNEMVILHLVKTHCYYVWL